MLLLLMRYLSSHRNNNGQTGFTLVELLLYLALFGVLLSNLVGIGFMLRGQEQKSQSVLTIETEANFVRDKIAWLLNNAYVVAPTSGSTGETLIVRSPDDIDTTLIINNGQLVLQTSTDTPVPLTTTGSEASHLTVQVDNGQLNLDFNLNGQTYNYHLQLHQNQ